MGDNNVNKSLSVLLLKTKYFCISKATLPSFQLPFRVRHLSVLSFLQPPVRSQWVSREVLCVDGERSALPGDALPAGTVPSLL